MSTEAVRQLAEAFKNTLQPEKETRNNAEQELNRLASSQPDYASCVLEVIGGAVFPLEIRLAAAVNFKNHIKRHWDPDESSDATGIREEEKGRIRMQLVAAMVCTPSEVRLQIGEALNLVSLKDFPQKWPELVPSLAQQLGQEDLSILRGVLETANSVFKRFRNTYMNSQVSNDLEVSQRGMLKPILAVLRFLTPQLESQDQRRLVDVCLCARLVFRIFYSLNVFGITEMMEVDLKEWMRLLFTYLEFSNPLLHSTNQDAPSILDALKTSVCEILNLFIQINEEDFEEYVEQFVGSVWKVLSITTLLPGQDKLAIAAISFLSNVAKGPYLQVFKRENVLEQIFTAVIIPSLRLREDDLELFNMNGIDYIRRDTEGSDSDTRRRAAADLVRALADRFPHEVTQLCTSYIATLLEEYAKNPIQNILAKDCAVYMVVALVVKGKTASMGATSLNALVPLMPFWKEEIEPEILAASGVNHAPLLKADALKFLTTFRIHIPKEILIAALPNIVALLQAESFVVHSYAATLIERVIVISESKTLARRDILPFVQPLFQNLFRAFDFPDSSENPYLMKCVMRVIEFVGKEIQHVAQDCLHALAQKLLQVCGNPQGPAFSHYLFESVAALVSSASETGAMNLDHMQATVFPAFEVVLQKDVQEFHPYVFQILAEFIDKRPSPLPEVYLSVLRPSLSPYLWEHHGNVPALTRLIRAYLRKVPDVIVHQHHLEAILGVFQRLNTLKAVEEFGLQILAEIYRCIAFPALETYQSTIWTLIFQRLQNAKTLKYTKEFIVFMSSVVLHLGILKLSEVLERIQKDITFILLEQIWVPSFGFIAGLANRKICCIALVNILTEFTPLLQRSPALWGRLLDALVKQLEGQKTGEDLGNAEPEMDDFSGYSAAFAQLRNARLSFDDEAAGIQDPKLMTALTALNAAMSNQLGQCIQQHVSEEVVQKLTQIMARGMN